MVELAAADAEPEAVLVTKEVGSDVVTVAVSIDTIPVLRLARTEESADRAED